MIGIALVGSHNVNWRLNLECVSAPLLASFKERGGVMLFDGSGLTDREQLFVENYLLDLNATKAALRAGYSPKSARSIGAENLTKPHIAVAVSRAMEERRARIRCDADAVLRQWWDIANVDPNELVELRRVNCRHCWGEGHELQRTQAERDNQKEEHDNAMAAYEAFKAGLTGEAREDGEEWKGKKKPTGVMKAPRPWSEKGGVGFDRWGDPNPECPECRGEGEVSVFLKDSRDLSPAARLLYEGVVVSKGQVALNVASRENARQWVAKHLGMFIERHEDVTQYTPEQRKARVLDLAREGARRKSAAEARAG